MKVQAFFCECCEQIQPEEKVFGISIVQDLYNIDYSFKTIAPDKADIHYCMDCYTNKVSNPAHLLVNRRKDETRYHEVLKELTYSLKKHCIYVHEKLMFASKKIK